MSTRSKIITAKDLRYGVNQGRQFVTVSTSKGIREIVALCASFFASLDPKPKWQQKIRPRFLQIIVVLLSFLNDNDLLESMEFLETTFGFRADRRNLELLIMKVLPYRSINAKVFLNSCITNFEGFSPAKRQSDLGSCWDTFITRSSCPSRILAAGYCPATRKRSALLGGQVAYRWLPIQ